MTAIVVLALLSPGLILIITGIILKGVGQ